MPKLQKSLFITLLLLVSISASLFMILESGSFFQQLYSDNTVVSFMGYWASFLNEVFMGIMAGVWLPGLKKGQSVSVHPVNYLFKFILVFLFLTTVCGSSMKTIYPLFESFQHQQNNQEVMKILKSQSYDNEASLKTFTRQNQRTNTAITVKEQTKTKEEMKQLIKQKKSTLVLWVQIITIVLIRFGVQLANLSCIWLVGWIYANSPKLEEKKAESTETKAIKTNGVKPVELLEKVQMQNDGNFATTQAVKNGQPKGKVSNQEKKISTPINTPTQKSKQKYIEKPVNVVTKAANKSLNTETIRLKNKISRLIRSRNEGISLSDIGKAIGEKEASLKEILNPNSRINNQHRPALESILLKIERLYQEESARAF